MQKEQKVQKQQIKPVKKRTKFLHYLLVYLMCLLAACVTWLLVRYSMREEHRAIDASLSINTVDLCEGTVGEDLYV